MAKIVKKTVRKRRRDRKNVEKGRELNERRAALECEE